MGCRFSKRNACLVKDHDELVAANTENENENEGSDLSSTFRVYSLEQIRIATSNFAVENQVVEWYERSGILYNGTLEEDDQRQVSVLRLGSCEWPTAQQFLKDARAVTRLRNHQLVKLLGYCNEGHERLLISEFSPNGTLAKHLFDHSGTTQPLKWAMRLRVALFVAQALEYCTSKQSIYYDLNPDNIFFDEDCNPRLSSFGLMTLPQVCRQVRFSSVAYEAPECCMGEFGPAAAVYSFGYLLLVLLSGKQIEPSQAFDLIRKGQVQMLIDSRLHGQLSSSNVSEVAGLAALCLQYNKIDRPKLNTVVSFLSPIQKEEEVPSSVLMGLQHGGGKDMLLSPLGEACSRKDLTTMHEMLVNLGYKDDDGTATELSFQMWTNQMQDTIKSKQMGDVAFRNKDFKAAIKNYTKFIDAAIMLSPTILARRSLSYLMSDSPHEARKDAIRAQEMFPTWHVASYLQAAAFFALGKEYEGQIALRKGSLLEKKDEASSL